MQSLHKGSVRRNFGVSSTSCLTSSRYGSDTMALMGCYCNAPAVGNQSFNICQFMSQFIWGPFLYHYTHITPIWPEYIYISVCVCVCVRICVCVTHIRVCTQTWTLHVYMSHACTCWCSLCVCARVCVLPSEMECVLFYIRKIAHRANVICCIMCPTLNKCYLISSYLI